MEKENFALNRVLLKKNRVFRDPIHGYIKVFHYVILQLINSKEMQRLRRIHQLGGTSQVYHTAEHSRFQHSLGVYEIVRRMLLEEKIGLTINDYDKLTAMCAALLHDIGHGPFSHAFENVFNISHEDYTVKAILSKETKINRILASYHEELPNDVTSILLKTHPNKILIQMISSQLDADRMDYLLRDSYFTGTSYGKFDLERILRTIEVFDNQIVIKESGIHAVENYILARYHMYWQVYYHPTARSYEQLLITIFKRIHDLKDKDYIKSLTYLVPFIYLKEVAIHDYLKLDETSVHYYFSLLMDCEDSILSDLCYRFINRKLFKHYSVKSSDEMMILTRIIEDSGYDSRYYLLTDDQQQVPYTHYGADHQVQEIKVLMEDNNEIRLLPEVSEIVKAIVDSKVNKVDRKIYFPQEVLKLITKM